MTNFVHWRKATWALVLWSAATATWLVVTSVAGGSIGMAALAGTFWLAGIAGLGLVWFMSQPLARQGRGFDDGFFVRPGRGNWRLVNLHRGL